jgi:c-di-GMP-related signal transduction protein
MHPELESQPQSVYVARQPILGPTRQVFGYELLYRGAENATCCTEVPDRASARVLTDSLLNMGLDTLTDGRKAFMNLTRALLLDETGMLAPSGKVVFELLENIDADAEVIDACRTLKSAGYTLALDDFVARSGAERLLPYVKFVKVDVLATTTESRRALADRLLPRGIRMVAEKVETAEMFEETRDAGYSLFQGYFFCRPQVFKSGALPAARVAHLRVLAAMNQPDLTVMHVEEIVKQEPSLSYRLLRCVNSAAFGIHREIHSIRQAIVLLGIDQIRTWASVWAVAGLNGSGCSEIVTIALLRARCCELIGHSVSEGQTASELFLLGLCSLLDTMLERPMSAVVDGLPLSASTRDALLGIDNERRRVLDAVIAWERGAWESAAEAASKAGVSGFDVAMAYAEALRWGRELTKAGVMQVH